MKKYHIIYSLVIFTFLCENIFSQGYHVRIGTIGNSITHGIALPNPATQAYPVVLQNLLNEIYGDTVIVKNFGLTTTTMLKNGDVSYWDCPNFRDYLAYAPEICLISLGTNDSKPQNWDLYGHEFVDDYLAMIDTIRLRNPQTKFLLCYPPPAYEVKWGIRDSVIVNWIIPAMDTVLAQTTDAEVIDFYTPMSDSVELFIDNIHPNAEGSAYMAEIILGRLIETDLIHEADTGYTFVTSLKSGSSLIAVGDTAQISWTCINADTVWLNGQLVPESGSLNVSPPVTTVYKLLARGELSTDSMEITQEVYAPQLARLRIYPNRPLMYSEDTASFRVFYHDQVNRLIEDTTYSVEWAVIEGEGTPLNETNTTVDYIAGPPGSLAKLLVSFENLSDTAFITVREADIVHSTFSDREIKVYPNPCDNMLNIAIETNGAPSLDAKLYDLKGDLCRYENYSMVGAGKQTLHFKTNGLSEGTYILSLEYSGEVFTDRIVISKE